jgi:Tfp pilus assembly protein FimV
MSSQLSLSLRMLRPAVPAAAAKQVRERWQNHREFYEEVSARPSLSVPACSLARARSALAAATASMHTHRRPPIAVNPDLKTGPFTLSEDEALEEAVAELGTHWIEVRYWRP